MDINTSLLAKAAFKMFRTWLGTTSEEGLRQYLNFLYKNIPLVTDDSVTLEEFDSKVKELMVENATSSSTT